MVWWWSITLLVFIGSIVTLFVVENSKQSRKDKNKTTNVATVVLIISVVSGIYFCAAFLIALFRGMEIRDQKIADMEKQLLRKITRLAREGKLEEFLSQNPGFLDSA